MSGRAILLLTCLFVAIVPRSVWAQAAWEYSPYQVHIWLAAAPQVELPPAAIDNLAAALAARAEVVCGAVWNVHAQAAPPMLRGDLLSGGEPSAERLKALAPDVLKADKLIVIRLTPGAIGWRIEARELDLRTRTWGTVVPKSAANVESLPLAAWDAAAATFTPITRIEMVEGPQVVARLRAGGLIVDPSSSALIEKDMVLRPIVRRNDRAGEPNPRGGIQAIPWTLLSVKVRTDSLLTCEMFSGYRAAIPSRGGVRTERLALLVRPEFASTRLTLESRTLPPHPLTGYEVHVRRPDEQESRLVGTTDWQGAIDLPAEGVLLSIFLVKNGTQLLARLPIVPGQVEQLSAPLADDDLRLQAEGAINALYSRVLDLVARREILAARFRARLKERNFDEAQLLLEDFRKLETRLDLGRSLDEIQQQARGADKLTQSRIDKLFTEARKLLQLKPLADDMVSTLAAEMVKAKATPAPAPTTPLAEAAPPAVN